MSTRHKPLTGPLADAVPAFADVSGEVHLGAPNKECSGCRKPFNAARKPRHSVRIYYPSSPIPLAFVYQICAACLLRCRRGGDERAAVMAKVDDYHEGISRE